MHYDSTLGALQVGCLLAAILYGMMCLQCYAFFQRSEQEGRLLSCFVLVLWTLSALHLFLIAYLQYSYMVTNFGNEAIINSVPWSTIAMIIVTEISTILVQSWYCYRVWILHDKDIIIIIPLLLSMVGSIAFGLPFEVKAFQTSSFISLESNRWLVFASLAFSTFADLYSAVVVSAYFLRQRVRTTPQTYTVMNTLTVYTVNTGLLTTILSLATVIALACMPDNFIYIGIYFLVGGMYSNSMMAWLNARDRLRQELRGSSAPLNEMPMTMIRFAQSERPPNTIGDDQRTGIFEEHAVVLEGCDSEGTELSTLADAAKDSVLV